MANLCAFQFWQRVFKVKWYDFNWNLDFLIEFECMIYTFCLSMKDKHRLENLKQLLKIDEIKDRTLLLPKIEEEWCSFHNLLQSSLHHVSEICMNLCHYSTLLKKKKKILCSHNYSVSMT